MKMFRVWGEDARYRREFEKSLPDIFEQFEIGRVHRLLNPKP